MVLTDIEEVVELEQGAHNSIIRWRNNRRRSNSSSSVSRVVQIDGDQKPARANVYQRRMTNESRIRVIPPLLLGEPTSFAPCRRFVLSHHRYCRQASSFRCCMQLRWVSSGQGLRDETHHHRHGPPTARCSQRRSSSSLYRR